MALRVFAGWLGRVTACVVAAAAAAACGLQPSRRGLRTGQFQGGNVLLVTIDTLRPDRLGAYGHSGALTPTLDRLATGVRFTQAFSHVPMTLPAHASILTGLTPRRTGVRNNGAFRLDDRIPTLGTWLKERGYRTGAFVGAFVLDARFGLARGFDTYDDRMPPGARVAFHVAERRAADVVSIAGDWILADSAQPWFAWVHLFDPHAPYEAPPEYRTGRPAYDAEVAYTDAALGRLLDRLRTARALDRTLIVVTADHGESLGEHGETTHGLFAYDSTVRVPLIVSSGAPDGAARVDGAAIDAPVAHMDIAPTILDLVGAAVPQGLDGQSLARPLAADRPIYIEAMDASLTRGWAPLRGLVRGGLKYIELPEDELYDLRSDPAEAHNIVGSDARADAMRRALRDLTSVREASAPPAAIDADAAARLRALGYAASTAPQGTATPASVAADPKRLVALNERFNSALTAFDSGDRTALAGFLAILRERPDFLSARTSAASVLLGEGRGAEAVRILEEAPAGQKASPELLARLGAAQRETGDLRAAVATLERARAADPQNLDVVQTLATAYAGLRRTDAARPLFQSLVSSGRAPATAWYNLGVFELQNDRRTDAAAALRHAVERDPAYGDAWNALGAALARDAPRDAIDAWQRAERLLPRDYDLLYNLGVLLADNGRAAEAVPYLQRFVREAPRDRYGADIGRVERILARTGR